MATDEKKFFPEYLDKGSKGPAVAVLQLLLLTHGYNQAIIVDGDYGDETARGVEELQQDLKIDVDGHFGPDTRAAWLESDGPDVNAILDIAFSGPAVYLNGDTVQ